MRQDFVQTLNSLVDHIDLKALKAFMQSHRDQGMALLDAARTQFEDRLVTYEFDMAYIGQTHTVSVPIEVTFDQNGCVVPPDHDAINAAFDAAYTQAFGRLLKNGVRRILNLRSAVTGKRPKFDLETLAPTNTDQASPKATRLVYFTGQWEETAIYARLSLPIGTVIKGPAILEQPDTTVLIEPTLQGRIDQFGNTIIERIGDVK